MIPTASRCEPHSGQVRVERPATGYLHFSQDASLTQRRGGTTVSQIARRDHDHREEDGERDERGEAVEEH